MNRATREVASEVSPGELLGPLVSGWRAPRSWAADPGSRHPPFPSSESPSPGMWLLPPSPVDARTSRSTQDGARPGARGVAGPRTQGAGPEGNPRGAVRLSAAAAGNWPASSGRRGAPEHPRTCRGSTREKNGYRRSLAPEERRLVPLKDGWMTCATC